MKLSIDLPALERLLGGDTELEVDLRKQIAEKFIENYLEIRIKALIESEAHQETLKAMRALLAQEIKVAVGSYTRAEYWSKTGYDQDNLTYQVKQIIETAVSKAVKETLDKCIADKISYYEREWAGVIDRKVKEVFNNNIETLIQEEVRRRLQTVAELAKGVAAREIK